LVVVGPRTGLAACRLDVAIGHGSMLGTSAATASGRLSRVATVPTWCVARSSLRSALPKVSAIQKLPALDATRREVQAAIRYME